MATTQSDVAKAKSASSDPEANEKAPSPQGLDAGSVTVSVDDDVLNLEDLDPVMNMKMHLVNNVSPASTVTV